MLYFNSTNGLYLVKTYKRYYIEKHRAGYHPRIRLFLD